MRSIVLIIFIVLTCCTEMKDYYYQPVNPPGGVEIFALASGDYLLVFYSENRNNGRFGGFLIFINTDKETLLEMQTTDEAVYLLEGNNFNLGIDTPVAILFSNESEYDPVINGYTVTEKVSKDHLVSNAWLTIRAYLTDEDGELLDVSLPGNPVFIEP
jgi:hypothetical protein